VTRLLLHSYHFPPIGGSGAQRPLKMVRALTRLGYESVVVTGGGATTDPWAPEDATLAAEIPPEIEVRRLASTDEPAPTAPWRAAAWRWLGIKEPWSKWWVDGSFRLGLQAGAGIDLIYVWMQPYASASAGALLARELKRPWVADLGDPWALDEMMAYPSALHRQLDRGRMRRVLGTAAAIVMSTPEAVARLRKEFPELATRPVVAIPNGYDAADFASEPPPLNNQKFRIVHTGYLHTALGRQHQRYRHLRRALRGSVPGLDILTRSHVHLVEAIDRLIDRDPELANVLELHLAGVMSQVDRDVAVRSPVTTLHGYLTHAGAISLMRTADTLFLPMQNLPEGVRATIVPGKMYEYLASGRPILAALPDGDARDILEQAGNATLARPDDVDGIANGILTQLERFRAGVPPTPPDRTVVERFEYSKLAAELASVFEAVLRRP
jgi:glycosyltransferase involved in cell wall biosynthesis